MTDKEILQKAIKKAISNGCPYNFIDISIDKWIKYKFYYAVIFDSDFAKAFWGEKEINTINWYPWPYQTIEKWRYELGQMAMVNEPLKYIEKFL